MCNKNTMKCIKYIPWWAWIIIIIIIGAGICSGAVAIKKAFIIEKEETEYGHKQEKEVERIEMSNTEIDFHLKKHDAKLDHEKETETERNAHKLYKIGIIFPCIVGILGAICCFIYLGFIRPKHQQQSNERNNGFPNVNGPSNVNVNQMNIPKAITSDYNNLRTMGYNKIDIIAAINNTTDLESALDYINQNVQNGYEPGARFSNNIEGNEETITVWI